VPESPAYLIELDRFNVSHASNQSNFRLRSRTNLRHLVISRVISSANSSADPPAKDGFGSKSPVRRFWKRTF